MEITRTRNIRSAGLLPPVLGDPISQTVFCGRRLAVLVSPENSQEMVLVITSRVDYKVNVIMWDQVYHLDYVLSKDHVTCVREGFKNISSIN